MLVLLRKVDEKIHIGHDIVVQVVEIKGNKVRLGITAPENVEIWRGELWANVQADAAAAAAEKEAEDG